MNDSSPPRSADFWRQRAAAASPHGRAVINGIQVEAFDGATFEAISPIDGRRLATVTACGDADVGAAVSSARAAFESGAWSTRAPAERKRVLLRFADRIDAHCDELALLETLDTGKPIR